MLPPFSLYVELLCPENGELTLFRNAGNLSANVHEVTSLKTITSTASTFNMSLRVVTVYNLREISLILSTNLKNLELIADFTGCILFAMRHYTLQLISTLNIHEMYCCFLTILHLHGFDSTGKFKLHFIFDHTIQPLAFFYLRFQWNGIDKLLYTVSANVVSNFPYLLE
jgi:hypothetical protein